MIKLADLGLAKSASEITGSLVGTPYYIPPEVWNKQPYDEMADMFSVGIVMWEVWYGVDVATKYNEPMFGQDLQKFKRNPFLPGQEKPPEIYIRMMMQCLGNDPRSRPSALECIRMLEPYTVG